MKVLVTGATGYVGHNLTLELARQGYDVNILVREPRSKFIPVHHRIKIFRGDILDKGSIIPSMTDCERVFHVAATVRLYSSKPSLFFDVNVEGTRHILDTALETGVKKLVFTSTCGVIGPSLNKPMAETDPRITGFNNDYELSKFLAERLLTEYVGRGLDAVIASASKVFGPGIETHPLSVNSLISRFIHRRLTICPGPSTLLSNYVFIDDLVQGHLQAMERGKAGEKYILGGENLSYDQFFEVLRRLSGTRGKPMHVSKTIARIYGHWHFLQHKIRGREPFFSGRGVHQVFCNKSFDCSRAINELQYRITPFANAAEQTIHFLKNNKHVH